MVDKESLVEEVARFFGTLQKSADAATVIALSGELGSGKTTFVQAVAHFYGIEDTVTSPTFVIEKVYELTQVPFARLIHIDAYRIKSEHELLVLGWKDIVADPGNLILIEWPERVPGLIPQNAIRIEFAFVDDDTRSIAYGA